MWCKGYSQIICWTLCEPEPGNGGSFPTALISAQTSGCPFLNDSPGGPVPGWAAFASSVPVCLFRQQLPLPLGFCWDCFCTDSSLDYLCPLIPRADGKATSVESPPLSKHSNTASGSTLFTRKNLEIAVRHLQLVSISPRYPSLVIFIEAVR